MSKLSVPRFLDCLCAEYNRVEGLLEEVVPMLFKDHDTDFSGFLNRCAGACWRPCSCGCVPERFCPCYLMLAVSLVIFRFANYIACRNHTLDLLYLMVYRPSTKIEMRYIVLVETVRGAKNDSELCCAFSSDCSWRILSYSPQPFPLFAGQKSQLSADCCL